MKLSDDDYKYYLQVVLDGLVDDETGEVFFSEELIRADFERKLKELLEHNN